MVGEDIADHDYEEGEGFFSLPSSPRALVNSEERIVDFKRWRELRDTGINLDYRCIKCRACNDCRNADQTEKESLRQDAEDLVAKGISQPGQVDSQVCDGKHAVTGDLSQVYHSLKLREDFFNLQRFL